MKRNQLPEINAGSMADIAFLLLIFFLVTTTMSIDAGISKKLPQKNEQQTNIIISDKNFLDININRNNQILIGDDIITLKDIKDIALEFIDNGGGKDLNGKSCTWCKGDKKATLSDHPSKAFIGIIADRNAKYETYIGVLNEVNVAYSTLRNRLAIQLYGKSYSSLEDAYKNAPENKETILNQIKTIRNKYPLLVSDVDEQL